MRRHQVRRNRGIAPLVRVAAALQVLWLALPACSDDEPPPEESDDSCGLGFLGERGADIELEITALGVGAVSSTPIHDGDELDITTPPQGGRVVFVGVRARNLGACAAQLRGTLRDPETQRATSDARTINLKPAPDGWGTSVDSDISTFSNLGVCPNTWSPRAVVGEDYQLEVRLTDKRGRSAAKSAVVRPICSEAEPGLATECRCICRDPMSASEACQ